MTDPVYFDPMAGEASAPFGGKPLDIPAGSPQIDPLRFASIEPDVLVIADPEAVPVRGDGSPYPLALVRGQETVFAGSYDDLLAHLIPDYPLAQSTADEVEHADAMRFAYLAQEANALQMLIVQHALDSGVLGEAADEALLLALGMNRAERLELPSGQWDIEALPLVLLTTHYAPYSDHPAPQGQIIWLDPTDARTYVRSLADAAGAQLVEHPDGDVSGDAEDPSES